MIIDKNDPLDFEAFVKWNEKIAYAASYKYNALFKVSISNGEAEYLQMFPDEKPNGVRLFTVAISCGEKIYFVPATADHIAVYEPDKNNLYNLHLETVDQEKYLHYKSNAKFNGGMVIDRYIYMTPCTYPGFIRINSDNDVIEYYNNWVGDGNYLFRKSLLIDENIIYLPSTINNKILRIDTNTCSGELISIDTKVGGWWSMCKQGDNFWLAPQIPGPIVKWDTKENIITEFGNYPMNFEGKDFYFTKVFRRGNQIVLIPAKANMGIILHTETGNMIPFTLKKGNKESVTRIWFEVDGYIYLSVSEEREIQYIKLNIANLSRENFAFRCSEKIDKLNYDIQCNFMKNRTIVKENKYFDLFDFLMEL